VITFLMFLTMLAAVAFLLVLAYFAGNIAKTLELIGANEPSTSNHGGDSKSFLSRIWFGVRAIDSQVAVLVPQATKLNQNLEALAGGMNALKGALKGALDAVEKQGGS
jgi:hypothetical protein